MNTIRRADLLETPPDPAAPAGNGVGPRREETLFAQIVLAADAAVIVASFLLAYVLRDRFAWYGDLFPLREHLWVLLLAVPLWLLLARIVGLTDSGVYVLRNRSYGLTLKVHAIGGLVLLSCLYLLRAVEVSRLFMQTFLAVSGAMLLAERFLICETFTRSARRRHPYTRRMLVLGTTPAAARLQWLLHMRPHWGAEIGGFLSTDAALTIASSFCRRPVLGRMMDLETLLDAEIFDEVVLAMPVEAAEFTGIVDACVARGVTFHALAHMPVPNQVRHHAEALGDGLYLMSLESTPQSVGPLLLKRLIDIVGAGAGMVVFGLAYLVVAPLIRIGSLGAAIFRQTRVGRNGRLFTLYKFRTMRPDAEAQKEALIALNDMRGHVFKMEHDPRVTPVGRVLRRLYIDELPQFWNVLKGDMSLVGPRPPTQDEVQYDEPRHRRRLSVRPGLTGPWQTRGNGAVIDFEDIVRMDCEYIDRWSIWSDVQMLLRTCATVARRSGQ